MPTINRLMRRLKTRPGTMTLHAKFKWSTKDWSSVNVHFFLFENAFNISRRAVSLSAGSLASILWVSISTPCTEITVVGKTVFSCFIGTFISLHTLRNVSRFLRHSGEFGGPTNIKSSRMCDIPRVLNFDCMTHCRARLNRSNIRHAVETPIGRHLS